MNTCYNPMSLEGKKILITGASSGIGKATAIECARLGAILVINGRNEERLQQTLDELEGSGHIMIEGDINDDETLKSLVSSSDHFDGLAHCAGIAVNALAPFATRKKINQLYESNLFAPIELTRLLIKHKKFVSGSSIVAVASIGGHTNFDAGNIIYGSAKAALSSWMKYLAKELGPKNIRVTSICPGMIETPMIRGGALTDEQLEQDMKKYALQRYGRPEEVANCISFLLSDASSFITGINLIVDGGNSI